MTKPWHIRNPELVQTIQKELLQNYPNLHLYIHNGIVSIRGSFPIVYDGAALDRYLIEISFPPDYPSSVPQVRETGGRIPNTADFHMEQDGTACLFIPDERWWVWPPGASFLDFLNGPVHNFFLGQSLVALGGKWPFGEWQHGIDGILEFYRNLLHTEDVNTIVRYLLFLSKKQPKGHWECPCGSGKKVRNCHHQQVRDLRERIPPNTAQETLKRLRINNSYTNKKPMEV